MNYVVELARAYVTRSYILYGLRILLVMLGVTFIPYFLLRTYWVIPLTLGAVAGGLTDFENRFSQRLHNTLIILCCFGLASVSAQILSPYPWIMGLGILVAPFFLTMLGGVNLRYGVISFGVLLVIIYTLMGAGMYSDWYTQPLLLTGGACWYYLVTLLMHLLFTVQPLQEQMASCYLKLAMFLEAKAALFDADEDKGFSWQLTNLAMVNSELVQSFVHMKSVLLLWLKNGRGHQKTERILDYYFIAQEIHEKISAIHGNYQQLSEVLRHSDILFRIQRIINLQAIACQKISYSLTHPAPYLHNYDFERAFKRLYTAIDHFQMHPSSQGQTCQVLRNLYQNLEAVELRLAGMASGQNPGAELKEHRELEAEEGEGCLDIWSRIKSNFTLHSSLFRHSVRISVVLTLGYIIVQMADIKQGYWIMLTTLFVCQPNFIATKKRIIWRMLGTLAGVGVGMVLIYLITGPEQQLMLIVLSGVLFFSFRLIRYAYATMFLTILVLFCFNLLGSGFEAMILRIIATLIGCAIAWLAILLIWPDWHYRDPVMIAKRALNANADYLQEILKQYQAGRSNALSYRVARRSAHLNDAELASIVGGMSAEPGTVPALLDKSFQLLQLNHTLLGYISGLGAHRRHLEEPALQALIQDSVEMIAVMFNQNIWTDNDRQTLIQATSINLQDYRNEHEETLPVVSQLILITEIAPELIRLINDFYQPATVPG